MSETQPHPSTESHSGWNLDFPSSAGRIGKALIKSQAEDFVVEEDLQLPSVSGGEHLCVFLEKVGDNTDYVARQLTRLAQCRPSDVGFCGLKDRHAVTRQWFSLYLPGKESQDDDLLGEISQGWRVLAAQRMTRKLRRGEHRGNRFSLRLRQIEGNREDLEQRLKTMMAQGCPNYFGSQRFGRNGANLDAAAAMPADAMDRRVDKSRRRGKKRGGAEQTKNVMYFSAARSWLFNQVLAARVADETWRQMLDGDPGLDDLRCPTGPLWGDGGSGAESPLAEREQNIAEQYPQLLHVFSTTRMKPERRPLVLRPCDLQWSWSEDDQLDISFWLAPGQFATTVLADVFDVVTGEPPSVEQRNRENREDTSFK